ncbi:hypothetical protein ACKXGD_18350, partial [Enterococcus lactis]|uniref:hypothetical protein n=1 Tax=Enterococcus lactis TaxID=357441 RepID=UPI0039083E7E
KREDTIVPQPLTEVLPTAPSKGFEPVAAPVPDKPDHAKKDAAVATKPVEPLAKIIATTPDGKQLLPAEAIVDLVLGELRKLN